MSFVPPHAFRELTIINSLYRSNAYILISMVFCAICKLQSLC